MRGARSPPAKPYVRRARQSRPSLDDSGFVPHRGRSVGGRQRVVGVEAERLIEIGDGTVVVALFHVGDTAVVEGDRTVGANPDRFVVVADGAVVIAHALVNDAPIGQRDGVGR